MGECLFDSRSDGLTSTTWAAFVTRGRCSICPSLLPASSAAHPADTTHVQDVRPVHLLRTAHTRTTPLGVCGVRCASVQCVEAEGRYNHQSILQIQSLPFELPAPNLDGDSLSRARLNAMRLALPIFSGSVPSTT